MKEAPNAEAALTVALHQRLAGELERLRIALPQAHQASTLLELVKLDASRIVQHMAQQIVADAQDVLAPTMVQAVLARTAMVADRWLWPDTSGGLVESFSALETLQLAAADGASEDPSNR